jgi:hypothetical protein
MVFFFANKEGYYLSQKVSISPMWSKLNFSIRGWYSIVIRLTAAYRTVRKTYSVLLIK